MAGWRVALVRDQDELGQARERMSSEVAIAPMQAFQRWPRWRRFAGERDQAGAGRASR